jgi:hypothetical protein
MHSSFPDGSRFHRASMTSQLAVDTFHLLMELCISIAIRVTYFCTWGGGVRRKKRILCGEVEALFEFSRHSSSLPASCCIPLCFSLSEIVNNTQRLEPIFSYMCKRFFTSSSAPEVFVVSIDHQYFIPHGQISNDQAAYRHAGAVLRPLAFFGS